MEFEGQPYYPLHLEHLPAGWSAAFLRDLCIEVQSGFASGEHNAEGNGVPHLRPMNIDRDGRLDFTVVKYVARDIDSRRLRSGDVLFNNTNSPVLVGKTAPVSTDADLAFSNHMTRLAPARGIDHRYLAHHLHYLWMGGFFIRRCNNHVNQASVSSETLASTIPVAVPPTGEQIRVVEAIDSTLSRLDAAVASLERVQAKLKAYRASVLKAAVEGRLVPTEAQVARKEKRTYEPADALLARIVKERRRRWEEAEIAKLKAAGKSPKDDKWTAKYEEPSPPDTSDLPGLPEGWCWARADQVSEFITKGTTPAKDEMNSGAGEIPYIKVYNLTFDTALDFTVDPTFVSRHTHTGSLARSICSPGDVLMNIVGPPLGKVSIIPATFPEWNINQAIARYRPFEGIETRYLAYVLLGDRALRWALKRAKTTAGQVNLTLQIARDLPIPVPPTGEQSRIVDEIEQQLSAAQSTGNIARKSWSRCVRLRQSILKWAFDGKLVDQDPNDEPADELLARICAERAAAVPTKTTRSLKAKAAT
jgi:type I restriction enzyme S subunit